MKKSIKFLFNIIISCALVGCGTFIGQKDHPDAGFGFHVKKENINLSIPEKGMSRINPNKKTYIILQVDGGGIMGIYPSQILPEIEKALDSSVGSRGPLLKDNLAACVGTSTGAIVAGCVAAGVKADVLKTYYEDTGVKLFQGKGKNPWGLYPFFRYKFKRNVFQAALYDVLKEYSYCNCATLTLDDLYQGPLLLIPAYDLVSKRTQFFRTREGNDQPLQYNGSTQLTDAISASAFSAALFFGKLPAPNFVWNYLEADGSQERRIGAVFNDGGQGTQNSAIVASALEAYARGWGDRSNEQVVIISLGTGNSYSPRDFERMKSISGFKQLYDFAIRNQARREISLLQIKALKSLAALNSSLHFYRFDWNTNDVDARGIGTDSFSVTNAQRDLYIKKANETMQRKQFSNLILDLKRLKNIARPGPEKERKNLKILN